MNFFYEKQCFSSNQPFRQVILLNASIQLKRYAVVDGAHFFGLVSPHTIRSRAFPVRHFSYPLTYLLNFIMSVILYCQLSQIILHLPQPIFFSVRHYLVPYITPKMSTLLCIWYQTFTLCSFQFVGHSFMV